MHLGNFGMPFASAELCYGGHKNHKTTKKLFFGFLNDCSVPLCNFEVVERPIGILFSEFLASLTKRQKFCHICRVSPCLTLHS